MTEGMTTHYKALEDSISKIADQLQTRSAIISKFETVMSTVQQHSESIAQNFSICEDIQKSLSAQQTVMTDIMHKLSRLEKQPIPRPLLPTPTIQQLPAHSSSYPTHQTLSHLPLQPTFIPLLRPPQIPYPRITHVYLNSKYHCFLATMHWDGYSR